VVAAATETFFGLLTDALDPSALARLFALKPRGADKGVPLLLPDRRRWHELVMELPPMAEELADRFWPGPLTIALPAVPTLDSRLLVDSTIGVRLAGASHAAELASRSNQVLTATSANAPGEPPARDAAAVRERFTEFIERGDLVVVEGLAPGGLPSTVVRVVSNAVTIVRAGAIPVELLTGQ
jgi:L-threonylcarbamoyladenylate synthase